MSMKALFTAPQKWSRPFVGGLLIIGILAGCSKETAGVPADAGISSNQEAPKTSKETDSVKPPSADVSPPAPQLPASGFAEVESSRPSPPPVKSKPAASPKPEATGKPATPAASSSGTGQGAAAPKPPASAPQNSGTKPQTVPSSGNGSGNGSGSADFSIVPDAGELIKPPSASTEPDTPASADTKPKITNGGLMSPPQVK
ncbi:hypothetical protein O9H85_31255 [Paenibacillus filicis]|uniref:Lipoprotein n=1 Tax=Paenibacillus gyeongsangnamensis TaxID=3388067 RepID=A0ABT4QIU4_9BACL|nr:hypothetical protein [Paenibacillus filicis]MCZ8516764.1 hypothetical protein [Paenibacillus filicis]